MTDFMAVLKKKCRHCDFVSTLNENLRDQFVCGLEKEAMRQRLFIEEKIDFEKAVTLAKLFETSEKVVLCIRMTNIGGASFVGVNGSGSHDSRRWSCIVCMPPTAHAMRAEIGVIGGQSSGFVPTSVTIFCRARPLPYALRDRVDAELDAIMATGVIEPVDCSDWATQLVIVSKSDGGIRVCADFNVTLNKVLSVDKYPVPRIDDLWSKLSGSKFYTKLDLSQAYFQVTLDDSKVYTVINTHRGLFMYNIIIYGLSSSPGIFQRIMSNLLRDISNVIVFLDDILIYGKTIESHLDTLDKVLQRLEQDGKGKIFWIYVIDNEGIQPDMDKDKPILAMTTPNNLPIRT